MKLAIPPALAQNLRDTARYLQRGDFPAAEKSLQPLLHTQARHPEVLRLQGILLHHKQHYTQAIACYRRALRVQPKRAAIHNNLASALRANGQVEEAIRTFEHAVALQPDLAAAWFNLGKTLKAHAYTEASLAPLEKALALQPRHHPARIALGDVQKALGNLPQAAAAYREVIRQVPAHAGAWWALSNLKTERFDQNDATAIQAALAATPEQSVENRTRLNFALFKALEDCGEYAAAFAALQQGNRLQRQQLRQQRKLWDREIFARQVRQFTQACAALPPVAERVRLNSDGGVIFVVSLPRSGSTLLEHMLAAHPLIEGASELPDLPIALQAGLDLANAELCTQLSAARWQELGAAYWHRTRRWRGTGKRWFVDKLPNNWVWSEAILRALPQAVILDCRRDARDTCFSNYTQLFAKGQAFSYDLEDLIAYWRCYERTMDEVRGRYPQRVHTVHYEALVDDPRPQLQTLLRALELEWDDACLNFNRSARVVRTASAAQVRQPLQRAKQARWLRYREQLQAVDAAFFN